MIMKIALLDDEPDILFLLKDVILEGLKGKYEFTIDTFEDPLKLDAKAEDFDLIITDYRIPNVETCLALNFIYTCRDVIIVSGFLGHTTRALIDGANEQRKRQHLKPIIPFDKPINDPILLTYIESFLVAHSHNQKRAS